MADGKVTFTSLAWPRFDAIVDQAAPDGDHSNPWHKNEEGLLTYGPDFETLRRLLAVPLSIGAGVRTGVPALALDVWLSYELRRAGFDRDATWPRPSHPRILPAPISQLIQKLGKTEGRWLSQRIARDSSISGVTSSSASILGKLYYKQVDVIMTGWATGPELLISTKRMDASFGRNAANRVEESYGDAKNLRQRHPLAALGFVYGLSYKATQTAPATVEWLKDLLGKLGEQDDAYHATALLFIDEGDFEVAGTDEVDVNEDALADSGLARREVAELPAEEVESSVDPDLNSAFWNVHIRDDEVPPALRVNSFLQKIVNRVLDGTPVTDHKEARRRRASAESLGSSDRE